MARVLPAPFVQGTGARPSSGVLSGSQGAGNRRACAKYFICGHPSALPLRDAGTPETEGPSPNRDSTVTYSVLQKHRVVRGPWKVGRGGPGLSCDSQVGRIQWPPWWRGLVARAQVWSEPGWHLPV